MAAAMNGRSSALSLFDKQFEDLLRGLRVVGKDLGNSEDGTKDTQLTAKERAPVKDLPEVADKSGMICSVCQVVFDSVEPQREHFKLDWHRFNLKQKLMDKPVLSEDAFEETISGEVSSISGSDSDTDSDDDLTLQSTQSSISPINDLLPEERDVTKSSSTGRQHPKLFFANEDGDVLSVYRGVLYSVKNIPCSLDVTLSLFTNLPKTSYWVILMTAGGHFAGAVFKGKDVLTHKTFHRYTVRAKRGTAQGARDAQQGGKQPKSAGASLRRYNEAALLQEVQDLLEAWSQHVEQCDRIFIRTPAYNKSMFFGGKKPPFKKDDERIRTIPFATRRPTFNEVKRVHQELSSVQLMGKESDVELQGLLTQLTQTETAESLPTVVEDKVQSWQESQNIDNHREGQEGMDSKEDDDEVKLDTASEVKPEETPKKTKKKKAKNKRIALLELQNGEKVSPEQHLWNRLYCAVVSGNKEVICSIFGVSFENTGKDEFEHNGDFSLKKADIDLDSRNSGLTVEAKSETIESSEDIEDGELNSKVSCLGCSKPDGNLVKEFVSTSVDERDFRASAFKGITEGCKTVSKGNRIGNSGEKTKTGSEETQELTASNGDMAAKSVLDVINGRFGEGGDTLLHVASRSSRVDVVSMLLECGADPAVKDDKGRPPFVVASSKETRNAFRRFMAANPDRYDYAKAQIPSALTAEMENEKEKRNAERKKAQKKAQKQRAKEQKAIERKKEEEEKEKNAYQALSEREKRALAAEKRFAQQMAAKQAGITSCCAWCSTSLAGQVPFERLTYKYCSTACVKAHRLDMENQKER